MNRIKFLILAGMVALAVAVPARAYAQTDEIQVYTAAIADQGVFNLTWHNNFTPVGIKTPAFPGAVVADKSLNGVPEWAYGVTPWFEAGLYMPLYSRDDYGGGWGLNGFKLRTLFVVPHADDRHFFYGANFEFSVNQPRWNPKRYSSEVRPIFGWHLKRTDVVINPIVDTEYDGFKNLEFVPAVRLAYNTTKTTAYAVETYSDFGPLKGFLPVSQQTQQVFGVIDHTKGTLDIEAGLGLGLTKGSDRMTLKLILSKDLNKKK